MRVALAMAVQAALATALLAGPALADGGEADEPLEHGKLSVCDATPLDAGALELALAWTPTWTRPGPAGLDARQQGTIQPLSLGIGYGLAEDLDASASVSIASIRQDPLDAAPGAAGAIAGPRRGAGLGDASLSLRWRFLALDGLDLAAVAGFTAPTGVPAAADRLGLTQGYWSAQGSLVASIDLGTRLTANLELGHGRPVSGPTDGAAGAWYGGAGLGWQVAAWLQPTLEVTYQQLLATGAPDTQCVAVTLGAVLPLRDELGLSVGLQQAIWGRHTVQHTAATLAVKTSF